MIVLEFLSFALHRRGFRVNQLQTKLNIGVNNLPLMVEGAEIESKFSPNFANLVALCF